MSPYKGAIRRGMSRPAEEIPVVERTTRSGLGTLFVSSSCPLPSMIDDADDEVSLLISEMADKMFFVPRSQICRSSTFLNGFIDGFEVGLKLGTNPTQDMTISTNLPSEVRRARRTAVTSWITPVTMVRLDGASETERRLRSFSGFRTMTVHW